MERWDDIAHEIVPDDARAIATRTALAAVYADLIGDAEEVEFLARTFCLLPCPADVAWASLHLAIANFELLDPLPEPAEVAAAGSVCAPHDFAPRGAAEVASMLLASAVTTLDADTADDHGPLLVASAGALLNSGGPPALMVGCGLVAGVSYAFVRAAAVRLEDPLITIERLIDDLDRVD